MARPRRRFDFGMCSFEVTGSGGQEDAADRFADVRAGLERSGTSIGIMDMMIAAHALTVGATLVTNNTRHFERVKGLSLENWAQ
jgi:tRNA(fMet)-specific endonuclease VapC